MMGVLPGVVDERAERFGGWVFLGVGLGTLAGATAWAAAIEDGGPDYWMGTLSAVATAAVWMLSVLWLFPRRTRQLMLVVVFYVGVLAVSMFLVTRSEAFTAFASVGYPFAFALFPARWAAFAVAGTAILPRIAQTGFGPSDDTPVWVFLISVAAPLLYAAWAVGVINTRLETTLKENAGLHAQLLTQAREAGVLDERQRMAREIHDTLAQGLTGIITQLQAADRAREDPERRERHLNHVQALARDSLTEARRSVQALRPEPLVDSRLPEALTELGRRWSETSEVAVEVETTGDARPLLPELEITLFRVAQEALANTGKHAHASRAGVTLSYLDDVVMLDVRDDGLGFAPATSGNGTGFGLQAMRTRVHRVAGTLTVESTPGEGTTINAQVPAIPAENSG